MPMSRRNRYYVTFMSGCAHSSVFKIFFFFFHLLPAACHPHLHVHMLVIALRGLSSTFRHRSLASVQSGSEAVVMAHMEMSPSVLKVHFVPILMQRLHAHE